MKQTWGLLRATNFIGKEALRSKFLNDIGVLSRVRFVH